MIDYYKINEEIVSKIGDISQKIPENTWKNSEYWGIIIPIFLLLFLLFTILALVFVGDFKFFCMVILSILSLLGSLFSLNRFSDYDEKKQIVETHKYFNDFKKRMLPVRNNMDGKELELFRKRISKINELCENSNFIEDMQLCPDNNADKYTVNVIMSAIYENKNIEKEYIKKASDYVR